MPIFTPIEHSIGQNGQNHAADLRRAQAIFLRTQLLDRQAFDQECLQLGLAQPLAQLQAELAAGLVDKPAERLDDILQGRIRLDSAFLPRTLAAIKAFSTAALGKSLDTLPADAATQAALDSFEGLELASAQVAQIDADASGLNLRFALPGLPPAEKRIAFAACRSFIAARYNWNGILKLMRFVHTQRGAAYAPPTQLLGRESDDALIMPAEGLRHLVELQIEHCLKTGEGQASALLIERLRREVDGLPGNNFFRQIVGQDPVAFMDERGNRSMGSPDNQLAEPNPLESSEEARYDYYRQLCLQRNGLWSERPGVANVLGLRRVLDRPERTEYNDTILLAYLEAQAEGPPRKRVHMVISTTEPGDRRNNRQLVAQTMTLLPGYHQYRQPAGRTHRALKQGANGGAIFFEAEDTTMNFHQGGNNFDYPKPRNSWTNWLQDYGIHHILQGRPSATYDAEALIEINRILSEIYYILSKYGADGQRPPYANLQDLTSRPAREVLGSDEDGNVRVAYRRADGQQVVEKYTAHRRAAWMLNFWLGQSGDRQKLAEILYYLTGEDYAQRPDWANLEAGTLLAILPKDCVQKVFETQARYASDPREIDGYAGQGFYTMMRGLRPSLTEAFEDRIRIEQLFESFGQYPILGGDLAQRLKQQMFIHTERHRERLLAYRSFDRHLGIERIGTLGVGGWSEGCQVVYDTELFYAFWSHLLRLASAAGQTRWYYTLVDVGPVA